MQKKWIWPGLAVVLVASAFLAAGQVSAHGFNFSTPELAQKVAEKIGMPQADVQKVLDEVRTEREAEMQTRMDEKLSQAVTDGKITEVQKQAIIAKHAEMRASMEANRDKLETMTPAERKVEMEKHRTELETWAKDQGIDLKLFFGGHKHGKGMGMRSEMHDSIN